MTAIARSTPVVASSNGTPISAVPSVTETSHARPAAETSPSSVSATLVKMQLPFTDSIAFGLVLYEVPGAYLPVGSPYLSGYALDPEVYGEFFDDVDYVGAFASKESAWIMGWTEFLGY